MNREATIEPSPLDQKERRWVRFKFDVPVRAIVHQGDVAVIRDGRGTEMSEGGMCLLVFLELGIGDQVEVEFTPPYSGGPIRVRGDVRNRSGYRYGVEFIIENAEQQHNVLRLCEALKMFAASEPKNA